jgi:hypothetical protein
MATFNNPYLGVSQHSTEINLRKEFLNTMFGAGPEIAKSQRGMIRVFRKTANGAMIPCPCVSSVTGEPDREIKCPVCLGEGNLWDETLVNFYHVRLGTETSTAMQDRPQTAGIMNTEMECFYLPYQVNLTKEDKIVTLSLDKEGIPMQPLKRFQLFRISELRAMRLDTGRLEFWKAFTYEDNSKYL